jgi:parvulin-like peptidyl-prolyl isomerase
MRKLVCSLVLLFAALTVSAAEVVEAVVARVGDRIITRTQFVKRLADGLGEIDQTVPPEQRAAKKAELRSGLLDEMLSELLIKDRADRIGITVTDSEVKESIKRLKEQYGISTDQQFTESLQKSGMTPAEMEARLRDTLITQKVFSRELRPRDELTDRELRDRYDREKDRYRLPERAHLREIVILKETGPQGVERSKQKAADAAAQARAGADFVKLIGTFSEAATKAKGGDLGDVQRGELLPDLDKAVFNAPSGTVVGPIESKSAWHIIKVEQRLPSEVPGFDSVKDRLKKDASDETFQRDYKTYVDRLRKEAFIQVIDANIPKA